MKVIVEVGTVRFTSQHDMHVAAILTQFLHSVAFNGQCVFRSMTHLHWSHRDYVSVLPLEPWNKLDMHIPAFRVQCQELRSPTMGLAVLVAGVSSTQQLRGRAQRR